MLKTVKRKKASTPLIVTLSFSIV